MYYVPWGVKVISLFAAVVEIVWPLIVISSTTKEVNPSISVVVAPKVNVDEISNIEDLLKFAFE